VTSTLVILRHAKATRNGAVPDPDRPLTPRGRADAGVAGAWLAQRGYRPDLVLCSPARRTRETWRVAALALPTGITVRYDEALYAGGSDELLDLVASLDEAISAVLLIGHNPAVSALSAVLDPVHADADGLRTCGIAVHSAETWAEYRTGGAPLTDAHTARA
jgi:phosphohistidine phosphatase